MSEAVFQVAYDGDALRQHSMDVDQLAPALLAIGNLCKIANTKVNGDRAKLNVFVRSDFEHKCFLVNLEVAQTLYDQVRAILGTEEVRTAKEILEWLGLIGAPTGIVYGLFAFLKKRRGRKVTEIRKADNSGSVVVAIEGENNPVTVNHFVLDLSNNPSALAAAKEIVRPTLQPGIDKVEFRSNGLVSEKITTKEAEQIINDYSAIVLGVSEVTPQIIDAHLVIYSPVLDADSNIWRFRWGDRIIRADIRETTIAQEAIRRGRITVGDTYKVKLQIIERKGADGRFLHDYKVVHVEDFFPGSQQLQLRPNNPDEGSW